MPRQRSTETDENASNSPPSNAKQFRPGCVFLATNHQPLPTTKSRRVRSHTFSYSNDYSTKPASRQGEPRQRRDHVYLPEDPENRTKKTSGSSANSGSVVTAGKVDMKKVNPMSKLDKHGGGGGSRGKMAAFLMGNGVYSDYDDEDEDDEIDYYFRTSAAFDYSVDTERNVIHSILEYFDVKNVDEFVLAINEHFDWSPSHAAYLVQTLISLAMQKHRSAFFMEAHRLLRELSARRLLTSNTIELGFRNLLEDLADLQLDVPDAIALFARFLALAISQKLVDADFIQRQRQRVQSGGGSSGIASDKSGSVTRNGVEVSGSGDAVSGVDDVDESETSLMEKALNRAADFLHINGGHLINNRMLGWTYHGDATKKLVEGFELVVKEYLCSLDVAEVEWQLKDIDAPHFHHEFVFQAILIGLEKIRKQARDSVHRLLENLTGSGMLRSTQINIGLRRLIEQLPDIRLDLPTVDVMFAEFLEEGRQFEYLSKTLIEQTLDELRSAPKDGSSDTGNCITMSGESRKRFASEGSQVPMGMSEAPLGGAGGFVQANDFEDEDE